MKLLRILALLLVTNSMLADCGPAMQLYPKSGKIYKNSNFLIEFYLISDTSIIKGLGTKYPIRLESKSETVEVEVIEILYGEKYLVQAILKPKRSLKGNEKYAFKIYNLPERYERQYKDRIKDSYDLKFPSYTVMDEVDMKPPKWNKEAQLINTSYFMLGCGPSSHAEFEYDIEDNANILFLTEVIENETNKKRSCYLAPRNGKLMVGAGMCGGHFNYILGNSYQVRFKILDVNGNKTAEWTKWYSYKIEMTKSKMRRQ